MFKGTDLALMFLGLLAFISWVLWLRENRARPVNERMNDLEAQVQRAYDHAVEVHSEFNALAAAVGLRRRQPGEPNKPPPWMPPPG